MYAVDPLDDVRRDGHALGARHRSTSRHASRNCARMNGSAQTGPIGRRAAPVKPASDTRKMNFSQIGTRPSSTASAWMSAPASASWICANAIAHARQLAEHLAEHDAAMGAGLLDDARSAQRGRDVGRAAEDRPLAVLRRPRPTLSTPFCTVSTDVRRPSIGRSSGSAVALSYVLTAIHHDIDRPDLRRVFFGRRPDGEIAEHRAPDLEAALPDRREVRAARDERDVVPGSRQLRAVIAAHGA